MPKTIDYPRTTYTSAWEVAEVVDDTGGKCAIETSAKKLGRKVSGSYKAIIGSAVKFGLLTSKREILTTTNLYRRIKHAYDKQEEKLYHREAFLHPPLFMQVCRKFRNRELPVHMFDVMLIREFGVEEINAQNVAKAFIEGARMVDVLDERNVIADIDQLAATQSPRRELASTEMPTNLFGRNSSPTPPLPTDAQPQSIASPTPYTNSLSTATSFVPPAVSAIKGRGDAVSNLFGLDSPEEESETASPTQPSPTADPTDSVLLPPSTENDAPTAATTTPVPLSLPISAPSPSYARPSIARKEPTATSATTTFSGYTIHISGPGIESQLTVQDTEDLAIVSILLEKIRRQLPSA